MVQSINTKVELVQKGTSFAGMTDYGQIMIGDKGFEFFNERNVEKFIQIPWKEIEYVIVSVIFILYSKFFCFEQVEQNPSFMNLF